MAPEPVRYSTRALGDLGTMPDDAIVWARVNLDASEVAPIAEHHGLAVEGDGTILRGPADRMRAAAAECIAHDADSR